MNLFSVFAALLLPLSAVAQTTLTGRVTDQKGHGLPGANVMLRGTYDGASTDSTGAFHFRTSRRDTATLFVSFIGYEPASRPISISISPDPIAIRLVEQANELNTVVITAGVFEASDSKRMTMLKPMDIVTTAGAQADITAAMNLLPGTQRVGDQTGLFVRGGSGEEAKVVIDGMIVQNPYFSQSPNLQSRGRFQPFMFKGTAFSTGGYSAQYGQALSSVLLLNTTDKNQNEGLGVSLNLANAGLQYDHATRNASVSATGYYGNLKPLFALVPQNVDWTHVPAFGGASLTYRLQPSKTGMLKLYGMYSDSRVGMNFIDPTSETGKAAFNQRNRTVFVTSTYTDSWDNGNWQVQSGLSYSHDTDATTYGTQDFGRGTDRLQGRVVLTRALGAANQVLFGTEGNVVTYRNSVSGAPYLLIDGYSAAFAETQVYVGRKLAIQSGVRGEYSSAINRFNLAPRVSMAYKTGPYSQVSLAYGQFYQTPDYRYLYRNTSLTYERADHLILNYQLIRNKRTFRIETYYKNYAQLVREFTGPNGTPGTYDASPYRFPWGRTDNTGYGYANGFDLFWRDQQTINGLDYWITYSFVDSKRLFQQFPTLATPSFISNHNIALIGKRYVEKISTNIGLTYTISTGRPYYNPTNPTFLADRTPAVTNLSFMASHLTHIGKNLTILYASADNILNTRNVYTYLYTPDRHDGSLPTRYAVGPASYRSFFVGGIVMLSRKAKVDVREM